MEGMMSKFPFNLFDRRWYYQSIVSKSTGANETAPQTAPPAATPAVEDVEISNSLAAVDLNGDKSSAEMTGSQEVTPPKQVPDEAEMRRVFEKLDENKDGVICSDELKHFMEKLGFEMSEEDLQAMVKTVDDNEDGTVDFDEFYSLYQQITGVAPEKDEAPEDEDDSLLDAFQIFDKDQDGYITAQELQKVLVNLGMPEGNSLKKCQKMIESVDADGNGQVDFKEFKKMMNSNALSQL
ncbi:calcium-binding protein CML [Marchantia polymorpha subsp. ruderalis]|uniref:EF-hand domain-containing protein n=2 Tax=Marchantia polymorpha TaxID=3197 RepID=A0AAF6BQG4_MARPO|nr:hypothetical protein MARPO_0016s0050 [Marchantia polymorpha]BBN14248.1 hypothetical protein Mp_6g10070 [Marchantia polymorpha subsp. ruderalis]|eukprot:PTQ44983.1 hypothetical protein MARPO_0016s0050 [Marchantia polymorpha]